MRNWQTKHRSAHFVRKHKGAPMNAYSMVRTNVLMDHHRFFGVDVLRTHELPVQPSQHDQIIQHESRPTTNLGS
jgi:hypothetical protein